MSYALMSSGGKDSTLALDRARRTGLDVRFLANIYDGSTSRVRFHGVRHELIEAQAASLRLECVQASAQPEEFEDVFLRVLDAPEFHVGTGDLQVDLAVNQINLPSFDLAE